MTILFSLCWLGEPWRVERYKAWLKYNLEHQQTLGWDRIVLVDNASDINELKKLNANIFDDQHNLIHECSGTKIDIYRFNDHLPRTGIWEYPYCWRGLDFSKQLIQHYQTDKMIYLDSDFYVLTPKLANYIKSLDEGWVSFWNKKYGFPEAAIHVLCKDQFDTLLKFPIPSYTHYNNQHMEWLLPFTYVSKTEFIGDRYGEGREQQTAEMDYYGQWSPGCPEMQYNLKGE